MAEFIPENFRTKDGRTVEVRSARPADGEEVWHYTRNILANDEFSLTTFREFALDVEGEREFLRNHLEKPGWLALVACLGGEIVGFLSFKNGDRERIAHTGEFGMSTAREVRGQGIGSMLLSSLLAWAGDSRLIEKVYLGMDDRNEPARALYEKHGFVREGFRPKDLKHEDGTYRDTVLMAKFVGDSV